MAPRAGLSLLACPYCRGKYTRLSTHVLKAHGDLMPAYICHHCDFRFPTACRLKLHLAHDCFERTSAARPGVPSRSAVPSRPERRCWRCNKTLSGKDFSRHDCSNGKRQPLKRTECPFCGKIAKASLYYHMRKYHLKYFMKQRNLSMRSNVSSESGSENDSSYTTYLSNIIYDPYENHTNALSENIIKRDNRVINPNPIKPATGKPIFMEDDIIISDDNSGYVISSDSDSEINRQLVPAKKEIIANIDVEIDLVIENPVGKRETSPNEIITIDDDEFDEDVNASDDKEDVNKTFVKSFVKERDKTVLESNVNYRNYFNSFMKPNAYQSDSEEDSSAMYEFLGLK